MRYGSLLLLTYARRDAIELAARLKLNLEAQCCRVWLDGPEILAGRERRSRCTGISEPWPISKTVGSMKVVDDCSFTVGRAKEEDSR